MCPAGYIVNPYGKASAVNVKLPAPLCHFPVHEAKLSGHMDRQLTDVTPRDTLPSFQPHDMRMYKEVKPWHRWVKSC
jgi:hypothetical protein